MSGTDIGYANTPVWSSHLYGDPPSLVQTPPCYAVSGTDIPYAAMRSSVRYCESEEYCISLRACYALCGTERAYGVIRHDSRQKVGDPPIVLRPCYAVSGMRGTDIRYPAIRLHTCYAMFCTNLSYGVTFPTGSLLAYGATGSPLPLPPSTVPPPLSPYAMPGTDIRYLPTLCPVLTYSISLRYARCMVLRYGATIKSYAATTKPYGATAKTCGATTKPYGATVWCYQPEFFCSRLLVSPIPLRTYYAVSGTNLVYATTHLLRGVRY
eukprot:1694907-Rhodomonas_salina.1